MPSPAHCVDPDEATAALALSLRRLARAGAYAGPAGDAAGSYHVYSPRNAFAGPTALLSSPDIARGMALGWLSATGRNGALTLSRQGRRAVKRQLADTAHGPATRATPPPRTPRAPRPTGATPRAQAPQRIEGPLLWLRNRKDRSGHPLITQAQYEAGTRLATDYGTSQLQARVTASWSPTAPCLRTGTAGGGVDISDAALAARDRVHTAMTVVGPEMGQLLLDVCCHDIGLETAERARGWPVRSGKVVLDMGLTALARHYGLEAHPQRDAAPPPRRPAARRWADPAFTPSLAHWERPEAPAASRDADATACP